MVSAVWFLFSVAAGYESSSVDAFGVGELSSVPDDVSVVEGKGSLWSLWTSGPVYPCMALMA